MVMNWVLVKKLTLHKYLEIQLTKWDKCWNIFSVRIGWSINTDHAGFSLTLVIWKLYFGLTIYDCRHWDDENNRWCEHQSDAE